DAALRSLSGGDGTLLVIGAPTGRMAPALAERGWKPRTWSRWCRGDQPGTPWPAEGVVDAATVRLPKARAAYLMALHAAASRVRPGGHIYVYGANDEGIRSALDPLRALFPGAHTADIRGHGRVQLAERPAELPGLVDTVDGWRRDVDLILPSGTYRWSVWPGLFAKGGLDAATATLLQVMPPPAAGDRVLDFGCGAGVISVELHAAAPDAVYTALDADALAVEATRRNAPHATVIASDGLAGVAGQRFSRIVSNPPFHQGKAEDFQVMTDLARQAPAHLLPGGALWVVVPRQVPIEGILGPVFRHVTAHHVDGRFQVVEAR
ncbi:MAG: methyltransferase, partial [Myxococcales bacterium]|nr:methyltransferase [Myxococcales bacterium]